MRLCARPEVNCSLTGNYSPFRACEAGCQTFWQNCTMGQPCTCKPHDEILCTCARMLSARLLRAGPPNGQWEVGCYKATLQLADKILTAANKEFGSNVRFGSIVRTP